MTRNCAVKKSLCGSDRCSRLSAAPQEDSDCAGFSAAALPPAAAVALAGASSVDVSERCTALTARGGGDEASDELAITPAKATK